ncbi:hypothetical protein IMCC3317_24680 [Kordia antarctica]|uniref:Uncharacterized protein n=1 Tax=Kordia antarctica TaxID=1218801 RepID=A0A7L4ZKP5_9FLAO|nr:hypothetical protein IMCC3317_24680 [Kordia antarctica]
MNSYGVVLLAASEFDKMRILQRNDLKSAGFIVLFISIILFIIGLFLISSKSRKYRKMEMELSNLKYVNKN